MPEAQSLPPGSIERDRWLDRLLVELLDLEGSAREGLLVERCEGDAELEAEARSLLAAAVEAIERAAISLSMSPLKTTRVMRFVATDGAATPARS